MWKQLYVRLFLLIKPLGLLQVLSYLAQMGSFAMQLLEMVERNELNRSLLTLLDENIANAHKGNQVIAIRELLDNLV